MSEHLSHSPEHRHGHIDTSQEHQRTAEVLRHKAEQAEAASPEHVEHLRHTVEQQAISAKETTVGEHESTHHATTYGVERKLKIHAYWHTLHRIQNRLSPTERAFSRVTHQPIIDKVSNATAQTVARPSGILLGSSFALAGSLILLYLTKHYGFSYNYLLFLMLFVGGFVLGLLIEAVLKLRPGHRKSR